MSDNSDAEQQTIEQTKPKKKRIISDSHRAALVANVAKARAIRVTKSKERKEGIIQDAEILKEIVAEKRKAKIFGIEDEPAELPKAPKTTKSKKEKIVESSESEQSEPDDASSEEDVSEEEVESEVSESSSDDEAEYVLKRAKAAPKSKATKPQIVKNKKIPVKKDKKDKKEKVAKASILDEMARMTAEIAALKKEKRKQSKVNVYVNQPEKEGKMSDKQRRDLLDL